MDTMRIPRLPNNDKTLTLPRTASDNDILHTAAWKNKIHSSSSRNGFMYPGGRQLSNVASKLCELNKPASDSNINGKCNALYSQTSDQFSWTKVSGANNGNEIVSGKCVVNNAFQIQSNEKIKSVLEAKRHEAEFRSCSEDGYESKPQFYLDKPFVGKVSALSRVDLDSEKNNLSDVTDEELEKLPDLDYQTRSVRCLKSKESNYALTPSSSDNDCNDLSDVRDEELLELPDLGTPSRVVIAQKCNSTIDQIKRVQQNSTPESAVINKVKRIHQLKRSVSSLESDDDYTSFFGSIKNRNKREIDEDTCAEPFYFNSCMSVVSGHADTPFNRSSLTINRAYSAESFMKMKERNGSKNNIYSRKSSRKNSSLDGDDDKMENGSGRLQMRRGALAEPEKMLISQELRERTQRGVEKRKTFMRKVSQFFNLHLRLNLEEDLI